VTTFKTATSRRKKKKNLIGKGQKLLFNISAKGKVKNHLYAIESSESAMEGQHREKGNEENGEEREIWDETG